MTTHPAFRRGASALLAIATSVALMTIAGSAGAAPPAPTAVTASPFPDLPSITLTPIVTSGLGFPVAITNAADGSGRLFLTDKSGFIRIWNGSQLLSTPFLDVSALISMGAEQGLLSVAFHPNYASNGFFYVYYTDTASPTYNLVIARYHVSAGDPNQADPNSAMIVLQVPHPINTNHNGGQLQFGADGYLYIGTGDGGSGGDPPNNAQTLSILLGKLMRIDVDGGSPYAIPPTNPFVGMAGARPEIWAYGLRNPWRYSFDRLTHDLYIGDVGQNLYEEVDFQPAGSLGGQNYGWHLMEGFHCYTPSTNCNDGSLTLPVVEYAHGPGCSVTGGYVYRGSQYPQLWGVYFYSDYCSGDISGLVHNCDGSWTTTPLLSSGFNVSAFGEDEAGEIYVANLGGGVYKITSTASHLAPAAAGMGPMSAIAGDPGFTLTVNGSGFGPDSVVRWKGANRTTTLVCPTQLAAFIPSSDLTTAGTATVTVFNPAPGGGTSSGMTFNINPHFLDVPLGYWAAAQIDKLINDGVSAGCGGRMFCPEAAVTRAQMAVFLLRSKNGPAYNPPAATGTVFTDVPASSFAAAWIEALSAAQVTGGCGGGKYCPSDAVTRAQMSVFLLRTLHGSSFTPPPATGTVFTDVPASSFAAAWIERLSAEGLTAGCGNGMFCPTLTVTRAQMAVFMVATFALP